MGDGGQVAGAGPMIRHPTTIPDQQASARSQEHSHSTSQTFSPFPVSSLAVLAHDSLPFSLARYLSESCSQLPRQTRLSYIASPPIPRITLLRNPPGSCGLRRLEAVVRRRCCACLPWNDSARQRTEIGLHVGACSHRPAKGCRPVDGSRTDLATRPLTTLSQSAGDAMQRQRYQQSRELQGRNMAPSPTA